MKILVVDHIGSFSLVPDLIEATKGKHKIVQMGSVIGEQFKSIFRDVAPDIVLCEWGDANAAELSSNLFRNQLGEFELIVRLHGYESHDWYVNRINWANVRKLVAVSPYFGRMMKSKLDRFEHKHCDFSVEVIANGVDLDKFALKSREQGLGSIAWVGYLNMKKGPALLRCCADSYPTMQFNVAGRFQCENTSRLLNNSPPNMHFYGWRDDMPEFYAANSWILSTSVTESFSYAVAEGMACGLTPMVYAWPGADELWPKECVWRSIVELGTIELKEPAECRQWIIDRYSKQQQIERFVDLIESLGR